MLQADILARILSDIVYDFLLYWYNRGENHSTIGVQFISLNQIIVSLLCPFKIYVMADRRKWLTDKLFSSMM